MSITRRGFIAGVGNVAGVLAGASVATGSALASETADKSASAVVDTQQVPDFLVKPEVPAEVSEEYDCDVCVIGMGLSGIAALKAAADAGVRVIGLEKQPQDSYSVIYMAGDFGVVGSQIQKDLGIEWAPKEDIIREMSKECGSRIDPWMMSYWYDHSGIDFDWFIEGADYEVLEGTAAEKKTDKQFYIRPKCFPKSENYDYHNEFYPYYHGTITTNPNMQWACQAAMDAAVAEGAQIIFGATGEQLIQDESGAVTGAYASTESGYIRINAQSVVLTCGDFGANREMVAYYDPEYADYDGGVNTGDGHRMGIWAGGRMENGPHAPMAHHMGGALGVDSFLQLNNKGKRFMNEDIPGQNLTQMLCRQPVSSDPTVAEQDIRSFQIFDSSWPEQIAEMPDGHGYVTHFVPDDEVDQYELVLSGFGLGWTSRQLVEDSVTYKADSLEELIDMMGLPKETALQEIEHYNELCEAGEDTDFGKTSRRMFPVENPPFYACAFSASKYMLVMIGGLECDHELHVLDDQDDPIPGLFVAGNNMGRRFLVDYPVIVAGISLATALTFGRLAGTNAASSVA